MFQSTNQLKHKLMVDLVDPCLHSKFHRFEARGCTRGIAGGSAFTGASRMMLQSSEDVSNAGIFREMDTLWMENHNFSWENPRTK